MAPLALVTNLLSRLSHLHCHIALDCPIGIITKWHNLHWSPGCITCIATLPWIALFTLSVSIELVSSSARGTSVKSAKGLSVTDGRTSGPKDQTQGTPGSNKKITNWDWAKQASGFRKHLFWSRTPNSWLVEYFERWRELCLFSIVKRRVVIMLIVI